MIAALVFFVLAAGFGLRIHHVIHGGRVGMTPLAGYIGAWTLVIAMYLADPLELDPMSLHAWTLIGISAVAFAFGYSIRAHQPTNQRVGAPSKPVLSPGDEGPLLRLWLICAVMGGALFAVYVYEIATIYGLSVGTLLSLRIDLGTGSVPAGFYYYIFAELLVPISVILALTTQRRRLLFMAAAAVATLALLATSGRSNATFALLWAFSAFALLQGGRLLRPRTIFAGMTAIIVAFAIFQVLGDTIGKTYTNSYTYARFGEQPPIPASFVTPYLYLEGPLPTFSALVRDTDTFSLGRNTFRPLFQVLGFVDHDIEVPPHIEQFRFIPYPFNVSTYLSPFYRDFGDVGVVVGPSAVGYLAGILYALWRRRPNPISLSLAAFACTVAIASVGNLLLIDLSRVLEVGALLFVYQVQSHGTANVSLSSKRRPAVFQRI